MELINHDFVWQQSDVFRHGEPFQLTGIVIDTPGA